MDRGEGGKNSFALCITQKKSMVQIKDNFFLQPDPKKGYFEGKLSYGYIYHSNKLNQFLLRLVLYLDWGKGSGFLRETVVAITSTLKAWSSGDVRLVEWDMRSIPGLEHQMM